MKSFGKVIAKAKKQSNEGLRIDAAQAAAAAADVTETRAMRDSASL